MYAIVSQATSQAAQASVRSSRRRRKTKTKRRPTEDSRKGSGSDTSSRRGSESIRSLDGFVDPSPSIPGVKPILKREDSKVSTSSRSENTVSFTKLEIAEHIVQLGDCPYCEGAPLSMSNVCLTRTSVDVNEFELERNSRRARKELVLSPSKRSHILLSMGYTIEDIAGAALTTQKARIERAQSLQNKKWDSFNAIGERVGRGFKKLMGTNPRDSSFEQKTMVSPVA